MTLADVVHTNYVHARRVRVLCEHVSSLIPQSARILDVGSGDGLLGLEIRKRRPDVQLRGIDTSIREKTCIPVDLFDGETIPYDENAFDVVLLVDVLHHTTDPLALLREAARVSRQAVLIKDHLNDGFLAGPTLRFMDRTGNQRYRVPLAYNYWSRRQWNRAFEQLGLNIALWKGKLNLYPWPASWIFERSLHFVAKLATR